MRNMTIVAIIFFMCIGALAVFFLVKTTSKKPTVESARVKIIPTATLQPTATPSATIAEMISPTPASSEETQQATAIIKTEKGNITLKLFSDVAPKTVTNFIKKAKDGYYTNLTFHRVEDWVIQGGDPLGTGTGGRSMPSELNDKPFIVGAVGVARTPVDKNISNDSQFFITKKDSQFLNGDYTNFGIVTNGMDVVNKIEIGDKITGIEIQ